MSEENHPANELPPLADLKTIGYDLFMKLGNLQVQTEQVRGQLNKVNQDIFNHPERKKSAPAAPPAPEKPEGEPA